MRCTAHSRDGFTLVELLVAIAIFVTVMASVALVFNGAIRTSKQGFQNQEAFELARGAMKVIERDLSRAFTNRNRGDKFTFYGTPIGFTYVGLISADASSAPNMARVTYVIYHDQFSSLAGAVAQYESKDGGIIPTYHLLRFVEPGADSLDSFPVPWTEFIDQDNLNVRLQDAVDQRVLNSGCPDVACQSLIAQSARREIWIKMLSGGAPADPNDPASFAVPSAWTDLPAFANRTPADYVVAENVRFLSVESMFDPTTPYCAPDLDALQVMVSNALATDYTPDFDDIFYNDGEDICVRIVNSGSDAPVFYDTSDMQFSTALVSGADGARPFFTYWDVGVQEYRWVEDPSTGDTDRFNVNTADDVVGPVAFQFWNDWRNLLADGLDNDEDNAILSFDGVDNDGDGTIDEPNEGVDEADEAYALTAGSPLDTRLPIAVTADLTLFFRSPYPGAPDFNERFTQRIDLPTAYRRAFKQREAVPETP